MGARTWHYLAAMLMCGAHGTLLFGVHFFASKELDATSGQLGTILFLGAGSYVFGCLIIAPLSDRIGRKRFIVAGPVVFAVCFALMSRATSVWHIYALQVPQGLSSGSFWPSIEASLAEEAPVGRLSAVLGVFNLAWATGQACGIIIGGIAYDWRARSPFLIAACFAVAVSAMTLAMVKRSRPGGAGGRPDPGGGVSPEEAPGRERAEVFFRAALLANFVGIGTAISVRSFFVKIAENQDYSSFDSALVLAMTFVIQLAAFFVLGRADFWQYRRMPLFAAQALMGGACLYMAFATSYGGILIAGLVVGGCLGLTYASSIFYGLDRGAARGSSSGLHEAVLGAGASLVPFIGGHIADLVGFERAAYVFAPGAIAVALAAEVIILARVRPEE